MKMNKELYTSAWMDPIKQQKVTELEQKRIQALILVRKSTLLVTVKLLLRGAYTGGEAIN